MQQSYYAGFVRRAGASLVDGFVLYVPSAAATYFGVTTGSVWLDVTVEMLIWWPYFAFFHASRWQATPGKRAFGIKVTGLAGNRIGFGRSTARYFASWISTLALLLGYLMVPFTRKRQAMHDLIAGTLVVNAEMEPGVLPPDHQVMPLTTNALTAVVASIVATVAIYTVMAIWATPYAEEGRYGEQGVPAGPPAQSFEVRYALYKFPFFGGEPVLVREDVRRYTLADVKVFPGPTGDGTSSVRRLDITDGFSIDANIYRGPRIDGFGLSLERGFGFSWEWFDLENDDVFSKRQGRGRIQVRFAQLEGGQEVAEIRFLEDVTLRFDRHFMVPFAAKPTDHLVVRKGSVLSLR